MGHICLQCIKNETNASVKWDNIESNKNRSIGLDYVGLGYRYGL
jgi:hypothetical protein